MVTIATTILTNDAVNIGDSNTFTFNSNLTATATEFSWLAGPGGFNAVHLTGKGFTFSGSGDDRELSGGTLSRIALDIDNDNGSTTAGDLVVTGTEGIDVSLLKKKDFAGFWSEVLKGDDVFNLVGFNNVDIGAGLGLVFGDDYASISSGGLALLDHGGNDTMFGANNEIHMIGDVVLIQGSVSGGIIVPATYEGGNDNIKGSISDFGNSMVGDAKLVLAFSELIGGDDIIDASLNSSTTICGDADNVQTGGAVRGGEDTITFGNSGQGSGDALFMLGENVSVIGGDDVISGGRLNVGGDVFNMSSNLKASSLVGGNDTITGGDFADTISGEVVSRNSFDNTVKGGDDILSGGLGDDLIYGEVAIGSLEGVKGGNDRINGGGGNDSLFGQTGRDRLIGGDGDDLMDGGQGSDNLAGGKGIDRIIGGAGKDVLSGGVDGDRFVFLRAAESQTGAGRDVISDFSRRQGDKIDVSSIDAMASDPGNDIFIDYIGKANFSAEGQIRAFQSGDNTVVEFNTSGKSGAEFQIELANFTASALRHADFILET